MLRPPFVADQQDARTSEVPNGYCPTNSDRAFACRPTSM
jgi:hypothetical protein